MRAHYLLVLLIVAGCDASDNDAEFLHDLMASRPTDFAAVLDNADAHRVQIIYTQIDRDAGNSPTFRSYTFRVDADEYFYPASTIKLPTAALALEKLNRLNRRGLDRNTVMLTGRDDAFQTEAVVDETSRTGLPSVGQYVRKILLVSDNDAYNRLYEFLGQAELNEAMRAKGYDGARIVHRLEVVLTPEQNRRTNPVRFLRGDETVYSQPAVRAEESDLAPESIPLGHAEIVAGERISGPKDFAQKNALPLQKLHDVILALMFPQSMPEARRFDLTDDDYAFLRREMSAYPGESGIKDYDDSLRYPDGYVKFLLFGGSEIDIPDSIRVFNKVGDAYGFLTDAAYIVDFDHGIEFMLAATIYTNANGTFNDNEYEYEEIGLPFLRNLGRAIYDFELARERAFSPDLSEFKNLR